ncbi:MAG TPA: hypothetical protein VNE38_02790 [Ktedonobacteraceae bacterium]|nr:hypothetical protein [Ktedonobacteraceae bacterium]
MSNRNLDYLPALPLGYNDLASLRSIIRASITYTRRVSHITRERDEQMHLLENLYLRLTTIPLSTVEIHVLLNVVEIYALNSTLLGFMSFVRKKVTPSPERDETLRDVERLRKALLKMLSANL